MLIFIKTKLSKLFELEGEKMLEKLCGIKSSRVILNFCIYMLCVIPAYIFLYESFRLGFWTILIIENIATYTLLNSDAIWDLIMEDLKGKGISLLIVSVVVLLIMLGVCLVRYSSVFWTLVITEGTFYLLFKIKDN